MGPEVTIAVISGAVALGSAGLSLHSIRVSHRLEEQRAEKTKREKVEEVMSKFRDPLLHAAFDLQSKLYNIVRQDFLGKYYVNGSEEERDYAVDSTLHVVAEYFGWAEILRREVQFLDLQDVERNRQFTDRLAKISRAFYDDKIDPVLRVFRGEQRAIGEVMLVDRRPTTAGPLVRECLGYAAFVERKREDPSFARWFEKLRRDVELLAKEPSEHDVRLIGLQNALVDLIDFLDPDCCHFDREVRTKMPVVIPGPT